MRQLLVAVAIITFAGWVHLYQFSADFTGREAMTDIRILLVLGKYVARGFVPYKDLWEMKPPGIFWYLGGIFSIFPTAMWSARIVDYLVYVAAGLAFVHLCRMGGVYRPLALIGAACWLYFAHHPRFDLGGFYTEEYMAICEVFSMAAAATYWRTQRPAYAMLSGAAAACALLFKHPGLAVVLPALLLLSTSFNAILMFGVSFVTPVILVVAYFWYRGALPQFMDCNVWFLLSYGGYSTGFPFAQRLGTFVQTLWPYLRESPALLGALVLGPVICLMHPNWIRCAAVLWIAADVTACAAQNTYYVQNYFIQLFPSLFFAATLGAAFLFQPQPQEQRSITAFRWVGVATVLLLCWLPLEEAYAARQPTVRQQWQVLLTGPSAWQTSIAGSYAEELGHYVRDRSTPEDRILVCGASSTTAGPSVSIYWTADRAPASRYFYPNMLNPDRFGKAVTDMRIGQHLALLQQEKPRYVIITDCPDYLNEIQSWLSANYRLEKSYSDPFPAQVWIRSSNENHATSDGRSGDRGVMGIATADMRAPQNAVLHARLGSSDLGGA